MLHVIVKLWPGKSETPRQKRADRIANDIMGVLGGGEESVSVAFEEISSEAGLSHVSQVLASLQHA